MLLHALLLVLAPQQAPGRPQRDVSDPGIIATGQRVTPAGVQSVFDGRVGGVRFGARPGELWVAVPGAVYRIAWQENRVVASSAYNGRPGVGGVAIDPLTGNAFVSSVGRLTASTAASPMPGSGPAPGAPSVAHLTVYSAEGTGARRGSDGDRATTAFASPALGDFMAGSPAVARKPGAGGRRAAIVPLPANDAVAILDATTGELIGNVALGVLPVAAVISEDGATAWVTTFGGEKPKNGQRSATQCCDPRAERVRIDARGVAERGSVARIDVKGGRVVVEIATGLHPTGLAWDQARQLLYVANGNSDSVSVIDTRRNRVVATIAVAPFRERRVGLAPTAVALAPNARTLFVALGGANAVAMYDVSAQQAGTGTARLRGLVPTGWYPSSLDVSADGKYLAVGTLLGVGSGTGATGGSPGKSGRYVHAVRGSVNVVPVPTDAQLGAYTTSVAQNNRLTLRTAPEGESLAPRANVAAVPVPERPGEPSPIRHVVYIIRENRTYDQVLGDIGKGASDSSLVIYGRDVTPNAHALAEQFVLLDHFFASGGNSADGHQWLTQANETDYPMWPLYYGRSYPSEGNDPLAYSSGGFLWEAARARGHNVSIFGEFAPAPSDSIAGVREKLLAQYRDSQPHDPAMFRQLMTRMYNTRSEIPSLDSLLVREYPGWTQETPDVVKADVFLEHLKSWEARDSMPALVMVILPSDHTVGTTPGWCTPKACVADNDLALGRLVEGLTHSAFWKSMAILVVEDDAQNGVDHIDGHRTVALVASPYARRGIIDSTFYSQLSMVKTIELMLGLPALSMFDLVANDMRASFIGERESPDFAGYSALTPKQSIYETNRPVGELRGEFAAQRRNAARASMRMKFDVPDAAPSDRLNRILWHDARGWGTPFPGVRRSIFLPLAVDIDDDDRQEKEVREV
jgi:YVTN family beta-propeller protein